MLLTCPTPDAADSSGALGSGLAIFSQLPIIEAHALPYSLSGVPHQVIQGDFYVNKAAAVATIRHPVLGEIEVWNTHMHAAGEGGAETDQAHRMAQAWQLATEIRRGARGGRYVFAVSPVRRGRMLERGASSRRVRVRQTSSILPECSRGGGRLPSESRPILCCDEAR